MASEALEGVIFQLPHIHSQRQLQVAPNIHLKPTYYSRIIVDFSSNSFAKIDTR